MSLWLVMTILCSAAAVGVSIPLIRRFENANGDNSARVFYEDQLKEIEKDLQNGSINAPEAESAKSEIHRRLATAEKQLTEAKPVSIPLRNLALVAASGLVILGGVSLYNILGSPNLQSSTAKPNAASASQAEQPASSTNPTVDQVKDMIAKLTAHLQSDPKDAQGWRMLGWSQFNVQNYKESADAYAKALALDPSNKDYKSAYAEALVQMADGIVTPKAQALIAEVLVADPKDSRGRFYDAQAHEQSGDQQGALDRWLALLADTPADAGWRNDVQQRIAELAKSTGRDVSAALAAPSSAPVISGEQKATIQAMPESDQKAMIKTMVERLATRLKAEPNDIEGWLRLMRSYQVLGEPEKAKDAMTTALSTFAADAASATKIKAAAVELGIK